jgi:hypothetical protein
MPTFPKTDHIRDTLFRFGEGGGEVSTFPKEVFKSLSDAPMRRQGVNGFTLG